MKGEISKRKKY